MFKIDSSSSASSRSSLDPASSSFTSRPASTHSAKLDKFPGLHGYPSHFGMDLRLTEDKITSIVHQVNFLLPALPAEFQVPIWNLLGYIAHLKGSVSESIEYYRTVLRLDPFNIVATSDLAHIADQAGRTEEKEELEERTHCWLEKHDLIKRKYIALAHLDIALFYYYSGLRQATMYHLNTAIKINPCCILPRFYYTLFAYLSDRISYHSAKDVSFHLSSLHFISETRHNVTLLDYLTWIIDTKSVFLPRDKTAVLEDKLQMFVKSTGSPLIFLLVARELYSIGYYQAAILQVKRSLQKQMSAGAYYLLALCQKKEYERDLEASTTDIGLMMSSGGGGPGTMASPPQVVIEETQHESKHQSSALLLPVRSIDQASCYSGNTRVSALRRSSPKESEILTVVSDANEDDGTIDPRILEMFENVRCACLQDPFDVSQLMLLTEILLLCHKIDLAIVYLHETLRRCADSAGGEKVMTYFRLAVCYVDQKDPEQGATYLRLYREKGGDVTTEVYVNLVVKLADTLMKLKLPLQAREWIQVMEQNQHPSCEHFIQRLKRLVAKDKHLLDAFNLDNRNNRNRKGMGSLRSKKSTVSHSAVS